MTTIVDTRAIRGALFGAAFVGGMLNVNWLWIIPTIIVLFWTYQHDDANK